MKIKLAAMEHKGIAEQSKKLNLKSQSLIKFYSKVFCFFIVIRKIRQIISGVTQSLLMNTKLSGCAN